jgi:hypothetical protein
VTQSFIGSDLPELHTPAADRISKSPAKVYLDSVSQSYSTT